MLRMALTFDKLSACGSTVRAKQMLEFLVAVTLDQTKQILEVMFSEHVRRAEMIQKWVLSLATETLQNHDFQVPFDM
jgi:uncharacterized lipoprotein YmbA